MSFIKRQLKNNYYDNNGDRNSWPLGDSGYPLQLFLLTPIIGAEPGTPQARYTAAHIRTRNCLERCIGLLKSYFRCLLSDRVLHYAPPFAAILHNIMRLHNIIDEDLVVVIEENDGGVEDVLENEDNLFQQRLQVRNNLIVNIFME